jgi:hypothetical protein
MLLAGYAQRNKVKGETLNNNTPILVEETS